MGTVSKEIADRIVAGEFDEDEPLKIVKYTNKWGGESYGVVCEGDDWNRYREAEFVQNPTVYWTKQGGKT